LHPEGFMRTDAIPPGGGTPGSDYKFMRTQLLDRYDVEYAILGGDEGIEVFTLANPHLASALARAANDWMVQEWLPRDARLKGSVVVAPQDPSGAAEEIRRIGGHPDMVQVIVSSGSQRPYGDPVCWPMFHAAAEMGLPVAAHLGGQGGVNANPTGNRPPQLLLGGARAALRDGHGPCREPYRARGLREVAYVAVRAYRVRRGVAAGDPVAP